MPGTSLALRTFVTGLIDGHKVTLTDPVDVVPWQVNGDFAQFAVVDTTVGQDRVFVIAFLARTTDESNAAPAHRDQRGTPSLLKDFHDGKDWEAYNCFILDFQVWSRQSLYAGKWPKVPTR